MTKRRITVDGRRVWREVPDDPQAELDKLIASQAAEMRLGQRARRQMFRDDTGKRERTVSYEALHYSE